MSEKTNMNISGASSMPGGEYGNVLISGCGKVLGDIKAEKMECSGVTKIEGNLVCHNLKLAGLLKVVGGVEAEHAKFDGAIAIDKLLNGEEIILTGRSLSKVKEIGCSSLLVKKGYISFFEQLFHPFRNILEADVIECDYCELEKTKAKIVRGNNIIIKKGCKIDRVEYYEQCQAMPNTVKEIVKR